MHPGESYRLRSNTLAIDPSDGRTIIDLPCGATVRIVSAPLRDTCLIPVIWEERSLIVFKVDLHKCGTLIKRPGSENRRMIHRRLWGKR
jgi:hypothetical protein